uniref:Ig-like domain-containing protein n=1 Tax=Anas platyrhynchos TaxID=8839 RepID=A0A8B9T0Y1_ANAPL
SPPSPVPLPAVPPRIRGSSKAPRKVSVIEAGETVLECEATGRPAPTVMWLKDGQPVVLGDGLSLSEQGWRLRIVLRAADSGAYTCLARNGAGEDAQLHVLSVLGEWGWGHRARPPVPSSLISASRPLSQCPQSSREVPVGSDVTFACEASGSPAPAVTWLKLGETPALPNKRVADGPRLSLGAVGPADTGVYVCVAANEAGEASRAFSLLDASHPTEMAVAVGAPLELTCVVAGVPAPAVTWEKDGQLLAGPWLSAGNESTLRIDSMEVGVADSGLYTCLATSPAGEDSRSFHVSARGSVAPVGRVRGPQRLGGGLFVDKRGWMGTGMGVLSCHPSHNPRHHRRAGGAAHPGVPHGCCAAPLHRVAPGGLPAAGRCAGGAAGPGPSPLSPIVLPVGTAADRGCPGGCQGDAHRQILAEGRFLRIWDVGAADGGEYVCRAGTATGDSGQSFQVEIHGEHRPAARLGRGRARSLSIPFIGDRDAQYFGVSYGWGNRKKGAGWV